MKLQKLAGAVSEIWQIFIRDSSSTTGGGLTGLTNASSGLTAYYHRDTDTTATAIALVTMTAGTFTSSGFKEIDATNMPGWYQLCPPNAALAAGAKSCGVHLKGVTNMAPLPIEVQLLAVNVDDAVRMGMTALPNAAAEAAGGLFTRGTGAGQINQDANGRIDANLKSILGTVLTETAGQIAAGVKKLFDVAAPVFTLTSVNQTGDAYARLGAPVGASISADIAGVQSDTDNIQTRIPAALVSGRIDASVGAMAAGVLTAAAIAADAITDAKVASDVTIASVTGAVGSVAAGGITASSFAAGAIDNAAIAADAIGSSELAASAVTEIQSGLSTLDAAGMRAAVGLAAANLDTQIATLATPTNITAGTITTVTNLTNAPANGDLTAAMKASVTTAASAATPVAASVTGNVGGNVVGSVGSVAGLTASDVGAIKAKTDNLPGDPADASDIAAAFGIVGAAITGLQSHGDGAWATATGFSTLDAAAVENAVWDATAASHVVSGSFGGEVNDMASAAGTIEGRIGTPNFGDLAGDIAHAQGVIDGIDGITSTLVMTAGKLWVLDEAGNPLPHTSDISTIESAIAALPAASDNADAVLAATYEGAETVQDHFRLARAALYGKANGLAGTTVHYRDAADAKNRLTATVDSDGNRSAMTTDAT